MKVLFATGEAWPFIKTGGLGDVAYSLPKALKEKGIEVLILTDKIDEFALKTMNEFEGKTSNL